MVPMRMLKKLRMLRGLFVVNFFRGVEIQRWAIFGLKSDMDQVVKKKSPTSKNILHGPSHYKSILY